ncbi:MAG: carboxymuconolactone decarboxylase family protein [Rhodospirillales bacterium]|nr:carboxymuconolactone decarboxylase family protein [Rhodospirillales bacterium]
MPSRKPELAEVRTRNTERLKAEAPDLFEGFTGMIDRHYVEGALNTREMELMAVSCSVATQCVPCLANHANKAVSAGATRDQVIQAAAIGGGPSYTIVRDHLLDFLDQTESSD